MDTSIYKEQVPVETGDMCSMTPRDHLRVLFQRKGIVIVAIVTITLVLCFGLFMRTPVYEAQVKMLITGEKQVQAPYYRELMGEQNIEASVTQSEIVTSGPVLERVVQALSLDQRLVQISPVKKSFLGVLHSLRLIGEDRSGLKEQSSVAFRMAVERLKRSTKVAPVRDTNLFTISVSGIDPEMVAVTANVISRSYIIFDLEQQLAELTLKYGERHPSVQQLKDNISRMQKNLNGSILANIDAIGPASVKIIEQASVPLKPVGPSRMIMLVLGMIMSVVTGVMLAFIIDYIDPAFRTPGEIESDLGLPILGSVPRCLKQKQGHSLDLTPRHARFYEALGDQLYGLLKDRKLKSILVTASGGGEGTTTMITNLGALLAQRAGHPVLLLDANFRHSSIHKFPGLDQRVGLADILTGKASLKEALQDAGHGLHVLPAGSTELNPVIFLDSLKLREVLAEAAKTYGIILVDAPDLVHYRDSLIIATHVDATVVVVSEGQTRRQVIKAALQPLVERKMNILGIIVNNRTFPIPKFLYERV